MIKHTESHLDHNLTEAQIAHVMERFADRDAFFIETIELPEDLGTVPCGLFGPLVGDEPIVETGDVLRVKRGTRPWFSRCIARFPRPVRTVTVIAGPHEGHGCIVYTMFGGPLAPREPGDIRKEMAALEEQRRPLMCSDDEGAKAEREAIHAKIVALREKRAESDAFWAQHALSMETK